MSSPTLTPSLSFVGGGRMAEALISGVLSSRGYKADRIYVADPDTARLDHLKRQYGIQIGLTNHEAVVSGDVVVLAVKPQVTVEVLKEIGDVLTKRLVISVVAGLRLGRIIEACGPQTRVIRAMPNTPAMVGEGMTALTIGPGVEESEVRGARQIFESVGKVVRIDERFMDAVTGLSGSGPAYVFLMIEAMADGGVKMGLPRETASLLAAQTVLGAARMVLETGQHPASLKDQVASPGGTTIAGLHRLEQGSLRGLLIDAVEAAAKRSRELGG
ncbi:MAG: pyrroline-5-carboxylate reductase [Nitrospira sp.]|nr:pyrroline-5-carboxylate reductase [Nitrospira sp.]